MKPRAVYSATLSGLLRPLPRYSERWIALAPFKIQTASMARCGHSTLPPPERLHHNIQHSNGYNILIDRRSSFPLGILNVHDLTAPSRPIFVSTIRANFHKSLGFWVSSTMTTDPTFKVEEFPGRFDESFSGVRGTPAPRFSRHVPPQPCGASISLQAPR